MGSFENAYWQWREGAKRYADAPPEQRPALDRVVAALAAELRRRLGGSFTVDELVDLYERGTSWCLDVAVQVAPGAPWAWDQRVIADAAFDRFLREASDFAGGRRIDAEQV